MSPSEHGPLHHSVRTWAILDVHIHNLSPLLNVYITATLQRNRATRSEPQKEALHTLGKNTGCVRSSRTTKAGNGFPQTKLVSWVVKKCQ